MNGPKVVFKIPIFGGINITETLVIGWFVIALITAVILWLTHDMKKVPETKKQVFAEMIVNTVNNLVKDNLGPKHMIYAPYIAALFSFSICGSLVSLIGLRSMTADINVTMGWALICFVMITYNKFKYNGFLGYFKGYTEPVVFMTPLNIISEVATPLSMGFRHFGNIAGGMVITSLLYAALGTLTKVLGLSLSFGGYDFNIFTVGIPAVLSIYFDLFSGFMQAFIFIMLTMANVGGAIPEEQQ